MPKAMIERTHPKLSVGAQCRLLSISRSSFCYDPQGETALNLELMLLIDKQVPETPFYGVRQMTWHLQNEGHAVNEKRIRRLMRLMRVRRENGPPDGFLYLLTADLPETQHPQARAGAQDLPAGRAADPTAQSGLVRRHHLSADAQRLSLSGGHHGLVHAQSAGLAYLQHRALVRHRFEERRIVRHWFKNTGARRGEAGFCLEALNEAIHRFGPPEIMNTDQGAQFTSFDWTDRLKRAKTKISLAAIACNRLPATDGRQSPILGQPSGIHSDQWRSCPRHVTSVAVAEI